MSMSHSPRMATISSLIEDFLRNPVIEIRLADSAEITQLRQQLKAAQREAVQARNLYGQEVNRSLRYEDYLRSIGVNPGTLK